MTRSADAAPAITDTHLRGVCPVLEVPFRVNESVDQEGFSRVVEHVLDTGVTSVMFPGFASEFHKLADDERSPLRALLLDQTNGRADVAAVIAVQDHATAVAVRRATEAVEAGADVISLLPPHQLGPSPSAVRAHIRTVLAAVAPTPMVLQYAPAQTGTSLDANAIAAIATDHVNLVAVKVESTPPGKLIGALAAGTPPLPALVGYAGLQLPDALLRGAIGVQPGCSFTELYLQFWNFWVSGDYPSAMALHTRMLPFLSYWMQSVEFIVAAEKLISMRRGLIENATCRAPGHTLDTLETAQVDAFLLEFGAELSGGSP